MRRILKKIANLTASFFILGIILIITGCVQRPPSNINNICAIFYENSKWYRSALKAEKHWRIPASVIMAVIYQESHFKARAKPPRLHIFWIIPWKRASSSYGYAQAITGTWQLYKRSTGHHFARRTSISDTCDFIGWNLNLAHRYLSYPVDDAYHLYLAYHEGIGNFRRGSYRQKKWLLKIAQKVEKRAVLYQEQFNQCRTSLKGRSHFFGLFR